MRLSRHIPIVAVLFAGGLLGYFTALAETSRLDVRPAQIVAVEPAPVVDLSMKNCGIASGGLSCCSKNSRAEHLIAAADFDAKEVMQLAQAQPKKADSGEKKLNFDNTTLYYHKWFIDRALMVLPAVAKVEEFLGTFEEFPPRQRAASFTIDQELEKL